MVSETELKNNATSYLKVQKQYVVIPESELVGLISISKRAGLKRQKQRSREINRCQEYLFALTDILQKAPISDFFRQQLLYEAELHWAHEWTESTAVDDLAKDLLGISLEERQFGIFDPQLALITELKYFNVICHLLLYRERNNLPNPVSRTLWKQDLDRRKAGL